MRSKNLNYYWGSLIIEELIRNGVDYFCISPGSRSAPLTLTAAQHPRARTMVCLDERGTAFHALGYARATGRTAAVIVTSGTAVANCFPAVVEAAMDNVPLLILSTDLPPESHDAGANQAVPQAGMFGHYPRWHFNFPCPDAAIDPAMVLTTVDQAVYRAQGRTAGPVHLNCLFREPLTPVRRTFSPAFKTTLADWERSPAPFTRYAAGPVLPPEHEINTLAALLKRTKKGLFILGRCAEAGTAEAAARLAGRLNWPVCADIRSGLRLRRETPNLVHHIDLLLLSDAFAARLNPETLVQVGGRPTSKRLAEHFQRRRPAHYIQINPHPFRRDPGHQVTLRMEAEISALVPELERQLPRRPMSAWLKKILGCNRAADAILESVLSAPNAGLTEPALARCLARLLPAGGGLFVSNSLPIRDLDSFSALAPSQLCCCDANRGANGIDGTLSTAIGFARGLNRPTTLLTGDLSLLHDMNALLTLKRLEQPFIIVLINNQGGGIFSFLPVARQPEALFETYFSTPQALDFASLAKAFGLDYHAPRSLDEFCTLYRRRLGILRAALIEITTNRAENYAFQTELQQKIRAL